MPGMSKFCDHIGTHSNTVSRPGDLSYRGRMYTVHAYTPSLTRRRALVAGALMARHDQVVCDFSAPRIVWVY